MTQESCDVVPLMTRRRTNQKQKDKSKKQTTNTQRTNKNSKQKTHPNEEPISGDLLCMEDIMYILLQKKKLTCFAATRICRIFRFTSFLGSWHLWIGSNVGLKARQSYGSLVGCSWNLSKLAWCNKVSSSASATVLRFRAVIQEDELRTDTGAQGTGKWRCPRGLVGVAALLCHGQTAGGGSILCWSASRRQVVTRPRQRTPTKKKQGTGQWTMDSAAHLAQPWIPHVGKDALLCNGSLRSWGMLQCTGSIRPLLFCTLVAKGVQTTMGTPCCCTSVGWWIPKSCVCDWRRGFPNPNNLIYIGIASAMVQGARPWWGSRCACRGWQVIPDIWVEHLRNDLRVSILVSTSLRVCCFGVFFVLFLFWVLLFWLCFVCSCLVVFLVWFITHGIVTEANYVQSLCQFNFCVPSVAGLCASIQSVFFATCNWTCGTTRRKIVGLGRKKSLLSRNLCLPFLFCLSFTPGTNH